MKDTIAAISTPAGKGGIAVIRISGKDTLAVAKRFVPNVTFRANQAQFGTFVADNKIVDEIVATTFLAPHSYTGEDVVEISCHGSTFIQEEILRQLITPCAEAPYARLAEPGEFTLRAFLNGKMDLTQAEAVADLIDSQSPNAHKMAINQLRGSYRSSLEELRQQFINLTSLLELELDFSEEEVEFADRTQLLSLTRQLQTEITRLVESFRIGNAIKSGVPVAIVGRPNVGKSTLLNALLGEERAIVSPIAGTTRDTVEDTLVLEGTLFRFIDTAGIHHSSDTIESAGIERSYKAIRNAQIVILLTDNPTEPCTLPDADLEGKTLIKVLNKIDLNSHNNLEDNIVPISAKTGQGLDQLRKALTDAVAIDTDKTILTNVRHQEAMMHILDALNHIYQGLTNGIPSDLVVVDIRDALYHLGEITGQVTNDNILGNIFANFCIGK